MKKKIAPSPRRQFIAKASLGLGGMMALPLLSHAKPIAPTSEDELNIIGPKDGFTPRSGHWYP